MDHYQHKWAFFLLFLCPCIMASSCPSKLQSGRFKIHPNKALDGVMAYWNKTVTREMLCTYFCDLQKCCYSLNNIKLINGTFRCQNFDRKSVENGSKLLASNESMYYESIKVRLNYYTTCQDVYEFGCFEANTYYLEVISSGKHLGVVCDLKTTNHGWTLMQRRYDNSVDFYRNWTEYKHGFGDLRGEFWLGLEKMRELTNSKPVLIRFDLWIRNTHWYAEYEEFLLGDENSGYELTVGQYRGNAGDSMSYLRNAKFSTFDRNQDTCNPNLLPCTETENGAWWYYCCSPARLNCQKRSTGTSIAARWNTIGGGLHTLTKTEVKFRFP